jgi:ABC-2 type transport system ATP-binding protein
MTLHALRLSSVSHRFGDVQALAAVDLSVEEGDIYGFLGLNAAGKTTAIRVIIGLIRARSGEVQVLGRSARGRPPEVFGRVGVLFEDFAAYSYLSGQEHLRLRARGLGLPSELAKSRAGEWLERVGLARWGGTRVRKYSLGMRRRLGLACALIGAPRLVLLDEPTNGLDPQGIADLRELILNLNRKEGVTFFLSSHILGEVELLCRKVGIIHQGRMLLEGSVGELTGRRAGCRLRVSPPGKAAAILKAAPWCLGAEREESRDGGDVETLQVRIEARDVPRMVGELVAAGLGVHEVHGAAESLEAVFQRTVAAASREEARSPAASPS